MKNLWLAALLLVPASEAAAARRRRVQQEEEPKKESYSTMRMEAAAIMGELKYQHGDLAGANETFRDSLNSSRGVMAPQSPVVALDLYRTAELAARRGDFETARQRLDILQSRFPDSEFAEKGRRLANLLPKPKGAGDETTPIAAVVTADQPEFILGRIQAATRARRDDQALQLCRFFLERYPKRAEAQEVRLLGAALYLRLGDEAGAERTLKYLVERGADAEVRAKALHLLAALELSQGRGAEVLRLVPDVDPGRAFSTWAARAQAWRGFAEMKAGQAQAAQRRWLALADSELSSPARAFALSGLAQAADARGESALSEDYLARAAAEAAKWGMEDLRAAAQLSNAHALYKRGKLEKAASAYGAFAAENPAHPQRAQALFQQGLALKRLGRRERAVAAFAELVKTQPDSVYAPDAHLQLGQLYTDLGAAEKALAEYEIMGKSGEARARKEALLLSAQVHYNAKRYKQAIPLYERFLDENPGETRRAQIEDLLLTSYWNGDRDNPGLIAAAAKYPDHPIVPHIRWELGAEAYRKGDWAKAADCLARFAADYPKSAHAAQSLFYLGEARLQLGDAKGASEAYRAMLAQAPKAEEAPLAELRLAGALRKLGDTQGAAAAYEKWLKKNPKHPEASTAWWTIAEAREAAGRSAEAAAAYLEVTDEPHRAAALFAAGRLNEKLKRLPQAMKIYETLRAARPANDGSRLRGLLRLGLIYEVQDKPMKAMPVYFEVMKLAPRGGADFKTAAQRVEALTADGSLVKRNSL